MAPIPLMTPTPLMAPILMKEHHARYGNRLHVIPPPEGIPFWAPITR